MLRVKLKVHSSLFVTEFRLSAWQHLYFAYTSFYNQITLDSLLKRFVKITAACTITKILFTIHLFTCHT